MGLFSGAEENGGRLVEHALGAGQTDGTEVVEHLAADPHEESLVGLAQKTDQVLVAVEQEAGYVMGLAMKEGRKRIAVTVRDEFAKENSTVTLEVTVGGVPG